MNNEDATARCVCCDRPMATEEDARQCNGSGEEMPQLCWRTFGNIQACESRRVDWRARALRAERDASVVIQNERERLAELALSDFQPFGTGIVARGFAEWIRAGGRPTS